LFFSLSVCPSFRRGLEARSGVNFQRRLVRILRDSSRPEVRGRLFLAEFLRIFGSDPRDSGSIPPGDIFSYFSDCQMVSNSRSIFRRLVGSSLSVRFSRDRNVPAGHF